MINEAVKEPSAATAQGVRQHARSAEAFSFICSLIHSDASASPSVRQSARWPCGCMHWEGERERGVQDAGRGDEEMGRQPVGSGCCRQKQWGGEEGCSGLALFC